MGGEEVVGVEDGVRGCKETPFKDLHTGVGPCVESTDTVVVAEH